MLKGITGIIKLIDLEVLIVNEAETLMNVFSSRGDREESKLFASIDELLNCLTESRI